MAFLHQDATGPRLQAETNRALDVLRFKQQRILLLEWSRTRSQLHGVITANYKAAAPTGSWSLPAYRGIESSLRTGVNEILKSFRRNGDALMTKGLRQLRWVSTLRHAWMLDQLTPPSRKVVVPAASRIKQGLVEAGIVQQIAGVTWRQRWQTWVESYANTLNNNLIMGAMNESALGDAIDEVDATRVNTPAAALDTAMVRLYDYEAEAEIQAGEDDVVQSNAALVEREVWKTRGDRRVCERCRANEGLTPAAADGDIPLHPNCNCYWLLVPVSYADLLKSGDPDDRDLAAEIFARGIVPNALVIRGPDDKITGKAVVTFSEWVQGMTQVLGEI